MILDSEALKKATEKLFIDYIDSGISEGKPFVDGIEDAIQTYLEIAVEPIIRRLDTQILLDKGIAKMQGEFLSEKDQKIKELEAELVEEKKSSSYWIKELQDILKMNKEIQEALAKDLSTLKQAVRELPITRIHHYAHTDYINKECVIIARHYVDFKAWQKLQEMVKE